MVPAGGWHAVRKAAGGMSNTKELDEAIEGLADAADFIADLDDNNLIENGRALIALRPKLAKAVDGLNLIMGEIAAATPDDTGRVAKRVHERLNQFREKLRT